MLEKPLGFHLMLRLRDDRVIAPSVAMRRRLARIVLEQGRDHRLLVFRAADTHLHLEVACERGAAGELARQIEIALVGGLRLESGFSPAHLRPIESQTHLQRTFFYTLKQETRHGLAVDPRFEASNLPDLLGLRLLGAYTVGNVRELLPRVRAEDLWSHLPEPAAETSLTALPEAIVAAACLPDLGGSSREVREARRAGLEVASGRARPGQLAGLLRVSAPTLRRLRAEPPLPALVRAIERQLQLGHLGSALGHVDCSLVAQCPAPGS